MIQLKPRAGSIKKTIAAAVSQIYMKAKDKDIRIQADIGDRLRTILFLLKPLFQSFKIWEKSGRLPFGRNEAGSRKELLESSRMAEMIEEKYGYDIGHLVSERIWWGLWGVGTD